MMLEDDGARDSAGRHDLHHPDPVGQLQERRATGCEIGDWPTCAADQSPKDVPGPEESSYFFFFPAFLAAFFFPPFFFAIFESPPRSLTRSCRVPALRWDEFLCGRVTAARPTRGSPRRHEASHHRCSTRRATWRIATVAQPQLITKTLFNSSWKGSRAMEGFESRSGEAA